MAQPLRKTVWQYSTKLNTLLPYSPATVLLGFYPKLKMYVHPKTYTAMFIYNCQNLEATKMSVSRRMDKQIVVHPDNGILFIARKR